MSVQIVGISGSPIPNSNTDRAVKRILELTGLTLADATNPATAPEIPPRMLGLPVCIHSAAIHPRAAAAAPKWVATKALVARPEAASALPALNPNHPTHRRQAPMKLSTRLCGLKPSPG